MLKFFFLILNLLNLYQVITKEAKTNLLYQDDDYLVYVENQEMVVTTKNTEWIRKISYFEKVYFFNIDSNL